MRDIQIIQGDCLEILATLAEDSADAAVLDPPYNIGFGYQSYADNRPDDDYLRWQLEILTELCRIVKPGGSILYLHYPETASRLYWSAPEVCALTPYEMLVWTYNAHTSGTPFRKASRLWCWWISKGDSPSYLNDDARRGQYRNPTDSRVQSLIARGIEGPVDYDWWHYEQVKNVSEEKSAHPCQLPVRMVRRVVELICPPQGLVIDPFCGSGTTAAACQQTGRKFLGMEIDPEYTLLARQRVSATPGSLFAETAP